MWLVITDDITAAGTLAHVRVDGQATRFSPGAAEDGEANAAVIAAPGPLLIATIEGRGHPAERDVRWMPTRKNAARAFAKAAATATNVGVAISGSPESQLMVLHALRIVGDVAPRAARGAVILTGPAAGERYRPEVGDAAEAAHEIDARWRSVIGAAIPFASRHSLPALALLSAGPLAAGQLGRALNARHLPPDAADALFSAGILWTDGTHVRPSPAARLLMDVVAEIAPDLLDAAGPGGIDAELARVADGGAPASRALDRSLAVLRAAAPARPIALPGGYLEARVLGVCATCGAPMRARLGGDGRHRLTCTPEKGPSCGLAYPLPVTAMPWPGGLPCACGAPRLRVSQRGWISAPRCAAGQDCTEVAA